jgi:hypothetical protein
VRSGIEKDSGQKYFENEKGGFFLSRLSLIEF